MRRISLLALAAGSAVIAGMATGRPGWAFIGSYVVVFCLGAAIGSWATNDPEPELYDVEQQDDPGEALVQHLIGMQERGRVRRDRGRERRERAREQQARDRDI